MILIKMFTCQFQLCLFVLLVSVVSVVLFRLVPMHDFISIVGLLVSLLLHGRSSGFISFVASKPKSFLQIKKNFY